jgi:hypothetical protein
MKSLLGKMLGHFIEKKGHVGKVNKNYFFSFIFIH